MKCVEQTKGRYVSNKRKSPPYMAQRCKNQAKVGRDGYMWISLPNKNMIYSWKHYGGVAHKRAISASSSLPQKKSVSKKKAVSKRKSASKKKAGYVKRKGKVGQTLYYKNGKRVAKKNVPAKYH